jgi:hypothetical protein
MPLTTSHQSQTPTYQYCSLRHGKIIRLLQIPDEDRDGLPCCHLIEVCLELQPKYKALSYTWGGPSREATDRGVTSEKCQQILCEEHILLVTQNLLDFILEARRSHRYLLETFIWIDAVCTYPDRYRTKCCRNLRFAPQFCEGVGSAHLACRRLNDYIDLPRPLTILSSIFPQSPSISHHDRRSQPLPPARPPRNRCAPSFY